jgi:hypothetical protein
MEIKHHVILGKNRRDAEMLCNEWLSENQEIRILRVHRPRREPRTLLTLLGGSNLPRVSIVIEYERIS